MGKYLEQSLIFVIISSFLVPLCLSKPTPFITSCLIDHHVTNFSLHPTTPDHFNSTPYNNLLLFSLQNLRFTSPKYLKPALIILPGSKQQLVSTLLCSKKGGYEVRIRCGGHSYEGLSSISDDGKPFVIIDMMNLDQVVVDLESKTAWVESGAILGQVYYAIAEQSRGEYGFSAGSCHTVGSGGHFSGGGVGLLSRKYGLAADNVVDALLVDVEGRVLDRASMGEDVFWAIRGGGGGSFGIVYAWKVKLLKVPPRVTVCQPTRGGKIEDMSQLVHKWQYVAPNLKDTFYLLLTLGASNNGNGTNIFTFFTGLYLGWKSEAIYMLNEKFPELEIKEDECKETSWLESYISYPFTGVSAGSTINDLNSRVMQNRNYFKAKSDYVQKPIPVEGILGAMDILINEPKGNIVLEPYGGKMSRIANDSTPFPHRKGNLYGILYMVSWEKEDDINRDWYLEWIRRFYDFMAPFVSSNPRAAYVNYLDLDLGGGAYDDVEEARIWGEKYFLNNYDRLVKAKTLIDPCNFFRHPQGIPPMPGDNNHCCKSSDM